MNRSVWIALAITLLLVCWMASGALSEEEAEAADAPTHNTALKVTVQHSRADWIQREVQIPGRTAPARRVVLKAETEGRVISTPSERGQPLKAGDLIVQLDEKDRALRVSQARALLEQRQLEYEAAERLHGRDLLPESELASARALYEAAQQQLRFAELDLEDIRIEAPFDAVLSERMVEVGDFLAQGDPIATVIEINPLKIRGYVTEREVVQLTLGNEGEATLNTGEKLNGALRYIAPDADEASRTFLVELWADNPDNAIPAGVTAQITLPTDRIKAHKISPAFVTLSDSGLFGVKLVNDSERVEFAEISMVKSDTDGLYVTGLPDEARIITIGQGFAIPGEKVEAIPAEEQPASRSEDLADTTPVTAP